MSNWSSEDHSDMNRSNSSNIQSSLYRPDLTDLTSIDKMNSALDWMTEVVEGGETSQLRDILALNVSIMQLNMRNSRTIGNCAAVAYHSVLKLSELSGTSGLCETLLTALEYHPDDIRIVSYCCRTLMKVENLCSSGEIFCRLVKILSAILSDSQLDVNGTLAGVNLLDKIAFDSGGIRLTQLGDAKMVEKILQGIRLQLGLDEYHKSLESSWCCLMNICATGEADSANAKIFLAAGGVEIFQQSYKKFGSHDEMVEKMLGLMANLTETTALRPKIATSDNFDIFKEILEQNRNIPTAYSNANILVNFISDSSVSWPLNSPIVAEVTVKLIDIINRWPLGTELYISTSSFAAELSCLKRPHVEVVRLFYIWKMANFTTLYPFHYCTILLAEGAEEVLTGLMGQPNCLVDTSKLTRILLLNIRDWAKCAGENGDETVEIFSVGQKFA